MLNIYKILFVGVLTVLYIGSTGILWAKPVLRGGLDTTFYGASAENPGFTKSNFNGIFHQNAHAKIYDPEKNKGSFNVNTRISYQTYSFEGMDPLDVQLFYGYFEYQFTDNFGMRIGRLIDFQNLGLTYFDGASFEFKIPKANLDFHIYGGYILNDDYILKEAEISSLSSLDYRNMVLPQREGDYIEGVDVSYKLPKVAILNLEWQARQNNAAMAEHYLSADLETVTYLKILKTYAYGVFDLIDLMPAQTLEGFQISVTESLHLFLEHEYFRPVFLQDSYWSMFPPLANNEVRAKLLYLLSKYFSVEAGYGGIFYAPEKSEIGHSVFLSLIHNRLAGFKVRLDTEYITGPLDNRFRNMLLLTKDLKFLFLILGGGLEYYNVDEYHTGYKTAYFLSGGGEIRFSKKFDTTLLVEYYSNPRYVYNVKGLIKGRYRF
ncbi:MAG: hypothetical protein ABUK01_05490 [Leptospirales bacterium]